MNVGDVIFVRGYEKSIVDDAIKFGEWIMGCGKKHFSRLFIHVAVYAGAGKVLEAQGFRKSGKASLSRYKGDYAVGRIRMTGEQRRQFMRALYSEDGLPYDWLGIGLVVLDILSFGLVHPKYIEHKRRYCSRYIAWAAAKAGVTVNGETPETLSEDPQVTMCKGL